MRIKRTALFTLGLLLVCWLLSLAGRDDFKAFAVPMKEPETIKPVSREIKFKAYKKNFTLNGYMAGDLLYLPLKQDKFKEMTQAFGADIDWNEKSQACEIKINTKKSTLKPREEKTKIRGVEIPNPLILIENQPYISLNALTQALDLRAGLDDKAGFFYLDPLVEVRLVHHEGGFYHLLVQSDSPISSKDFILKEPARFVIDVPDTVLKNENDSVVHPDAGEIKFAQFSENPNQVRVVIPLSEKVLVKDLSRMDLKEVEVSIRLPELYAPGQNFPAEKMVDFQVESLKDETKIWLKFSGAVQYEWHRLRLPDNRLFIDFPQTTVTFGKKELNVDHPYLKEVKVAQFQVKPLAIARVVLQLTEPAEVEFVKSEKFNDFLLIRIKKNLINPEQEILRGVGATGFPTKGRVICIDPGHGGSDPGAVNSSLSLLEKDINLDISLRLSKILTSWGWNVVLTRYDDRDVSYQGSSAREELGARCYVANAMNAELFVCIHCNSSVNNGCTGSSIHWYKTSDVKLAKAMEKVFKENPKVKCLGLRQDRFYVLAHTRMPAILVECAFMSNTGEGKLLRDPDYRQALAQDIAEGLKGYK